MRLSVDARAAKHRPPFAKSATHRLVVLTCLVAGKIEVRVQYGAIQVAKLAVRRTPSVFGKLLAFGASRFAQERVGTGNVGCEARVQKVETSTELD